MQLEDWGSMMTGPVPSEPPPKDPPAPALGLDLFQCLLRCDPEEVNRTLKDIVDHHIPWEPLETYDKDIGSMSLECKLRIRKGVYVAARKRYADLMASDDERIVAMKVAIIFCLFHASEPASGSFDVLQSRLLGRYGPEMSLRRAAVRGSFPGEFCDVSAEAVDAFFSSDEFDDLRRAFYLRSYEDPHVGGGAVGAIMHNPRRFVEKLQEILAEGGVTRWYIPVLWGQ